MAVINEVLFVDGELVTPAELSAISKAVSLWIAGDLLMQEHAGGEWATDTAVQHPVGDGTNATDLGGANLRSYGFIGQGLRVTYGNATAIAVLAGWGLQYASTGVPSGESATRVVRLASAMNLTVAVASSAHYRRDLVVAKWNDKTSTASVQKMDADGNIASSTETTRRFPEANDTSPTVQVVQGTEDTDASLAPRPSVPSGYVALAEILVDSTGIANRAQNNAGTQPGIRDLRPRLVAKKAAGHVEARRASTSMDEGSAIPSATRLGAKAVGEVIAHGLFSLTATATSYTLDTGHDWRDMLVTVEHSSLFAEALLPGGGSDDGLTWNDAPVSGSATMATAGFYSGNGSTDGTATYHSAASKTAADGSGATLTFYADSTTGALCLRGRTDSGVKYVYWRARGFGPCGKRNLSTREA